MKSILTLFIAAAISFPAFAQQSANMVVFSDGLPFYLVINGVRQNLNPETNVRVTDLKSEAQRVKIIFEDVSIPSIERNAYCEFGKETTYMIKGSKKGLKLAGYGMPVDIASTTGAGSSTMVYHAEETQTTAAPAPAPVNTGTVSSTSTTTTTTTTTGSSSTVHVNEHATGTSEHVSMDVNMGGVGFNVNVNVNETGSSTQVSDPNMNTNTQVTYTETVTTTTTASGGADYSATTDMSNTRPAAGGCVGGMSDADFATMKKSIQSKDFADTKMTVARQVVRSKSCISAAQVREVMGLFDFEDDKLVFAKFAYDYCVDKDNYFVVNDAFDFESTIEELDEYIHSR